MDYIDIIDRSLRAFFFSSYFVNQGGYCSNRTNPTLRWYDGVPASPGGMYGYKRDKEIDMPPKTEEGARGPHRLFIGEVTALRTDLLDT